MSQLQCPDTDDIMAWLAGSAEESFASSIADHVENCQHCIELVERLESVDDGIVDYLRIAVADVGSGQPMTADFETQYRNVSASPLVGTRVGEYRILETLGHGGMGTVYHAIHHRLHRHVALKVLSESIANSRTGIARFHREMEAIGRLDHPNIVQALDAGESNGQHYLAMELLHGSDLSALVTHGGSLSVQDTCEVGRQISRALKYAHDRGMVHRDVKPSNIMLTLDNNSQARAKLLDLGLAMIGTGSDKQLTDAGQLMGTLEYMAPEQTSAAQAVDHRADMYSLGSTLYRLLTGTIPLEEWNTPARRLNALIHQDIPSITEKLPDLDPGLASLIDRMHDRAPGNRPDLAETIKTLAENAEGHSLRELLFAAKGPVNARAATVALESPQNDTTPLLPKTRVVPEDDQPAETSPELSGTTNSVRRTVVTVGAVILVAAALFGLHSFTRTDSARPAPSTNSNAAKVEQAPDTTSRF